MKQVKPVIDEVRMRATQVNIVHLQQERALAFLEEMEAEHAKPFQSGKEMARIIADTARSTVTFSCTITYMELVGWLVSNLGHINFFLSNHPDALKMLLNGIGQGIGEMEAARQKALQELDEIIRTSAVKIQLQ